jgi:peptidyl-prolyl cis-trans isomerase D
MSRKELPYKIDAEQDIMSVIKIRHEIPYHSRPFMWNRTHHIETVVLDMINAWREDDLVKRMQAKADELIQAVKTGKSLQALAKELNLEMKEASGLKRSAQSEALSQQAVAAAFSVPVKETTSAIGINPDERIIVSVDAASLSEAATALADAGRIANQMQRSLTDDYTNVYVLRTQQDLGVTINETVRAMALGLN